MSGRRLKILFTMGTSFSLSGLTRAETRQAPTSFGSYASALISLESGDCYRAELGLTGIICSVTNTATANFGND